MDTIRASFDESLEPFTFHDEPMVSDNAVALPIPARGERAAGAFWPVAIAIPAGLAIGLWKRPRAALLAGLGAALGLGLARWQLQRWFSESADYRVEKRIGPLEIRRYRPAQIVETTVTHRTYDESVTEGFRRLFGYIHDAGIPMTTPVTTTVDSGGITIAFVLPEALILAPDPKDNRLVVHEVGARRVAALRYHDQVHGARAHAMERELLGRLRKARIDPRGDPWTSNYDPPTTITPLRRVEACVEIV